MSEQEHTRQKATSPTPATCWSVWQRPDRQISRQSNLSGAASGLGYLFGNKSRVSVTPSYDVSKRDFRCVISGDFGLSGQTRAVLRMEEFDSTLTLVRDLDDR